MARARGSRLLVPLAILLAALPALAGCLDRDSRPADDAGRGGGLPDAPACVPLAVAPASAALAPYVDTPIRVVFTNCGSGKATVHAIDVCGDLPYARLEAVKDGARVAFLTQREGRVALPERECFAVPPPLEVGPGENATIEASWDATIVPAGCENFCPRTNRTPAPAGPYSIRATVLVDGRNETSASAPVEVAAASVPPLPESPEVVFLLNDTYAPSERATVRVRNVGERTLTYSVYYAACGFEFLRDDGTRFIIPPGTHCDIANEADLAPGAEATLFVWHLDECTRDEWGCAASKPLQPGRYHVRAEFAEPRDPGSRGAPSAKAGATFTIA